MIEVSSYIWKTYCSVWWVLQTQQEAVVEVHKCEQPAFGGSRGTRVGVWEWCVWRAGERWWWRCEAWRSGCMFFGEGDVVGGVRIVRIPE